MGLFKTIINSKIQVNIPTWLTLLRIILIPFFILAFYLPYSWAATASAATFAFAATTDWLDGFLARRWEQTTGFGAFLDPVADKIMAASALLLITQHYHVWWITLPAIVIISREIIIASLREWMARLNKINKVTVSSLGKTKTVVQMISVIGLLWRSHPIIEWAGVILFYIAALLTLWSMLQYVSIAWEDLILSDKMS